MYENQKKQQQYLSGMVISPILSKHNTDTNTSYAQQK